MSILARLSVLVLAGILLVPLTTQAGKVVVRKESEPFDAFAVRDQVQRDFQWKEDLRMQQQIQILQALPSGCMPYAVPYRYFTCGAQTYRPYQYQDKELYIQIDPPQPQTQQ